jgi:hypothetical protein
MIKRIKCLIGLHKYYVLIHLTKCCRKLGCRHCNKEFAMNDNLQVIVPWDDEFEEIYKIFGVL